MNEHSATNDSATNDSASNDSASNDSRTSATGDIGLELPASIEAAWGIRDRPHKGPKPGLSLRRVVEAAVRVAESEGLAAVSMSRVATELGASTMSLYRYVGAKDELLDLMADEAYGPPPDLGQDSANQDSANQDSAGQGPAVLDWRKGLSQWAWALRAAYYRNPWALQIPIRGLPVTPNQVGWYETGLSSMAATALSEDEKSSAVLLVNTYTRSEATVSVTIGAAIEASGSPPEQWMAYYGRMLTSLTDPHRFPAIRRVVAAGIFDRADPPDKEFAFGLERILDGIDMLVRARTATRD